MFIVQDKGELGGVFVVCGNVLTLGKLIGLLFCLTSSLLFFV